MASNEWKILDEASGARVRSYSFGPGLANTFAVRNKDASWAVISPAVGMDDEGFAALEGGVSALIEPNGFHHLGLPEWTKRYPDAKVYAPEPAAKRIAKKQPSVGAIRPLSELDGLADGVTIAALPHFKNPDTYARVETKAGSMWFFNDVIMNSPLPKNPLFGFVFKVTKSGPGLAVNRVVTMFLGCNKKAFKPWLLGELKEHPIQSFVPCHGTVLEGDNLAKRVQTIVEEW